MLRRLVEKFAPGWVISILVCVAYRIWVNREIGGKHRRNCPICGYTGYFRATGFPPRYDGERPRCKSVERYRLLKLAIEREVIIGPDDRVLHFALGKYFADMVRPIAANYFAADLQDRIGNHGFALKEFTAVEPYVSWYGLVRGIRISAGLMICWPYELPGDLPLLV